MIKRLIFLCFIVFSIFFFAALVVGADTAQDSARSSIPATTPEGMSVPNEIIVKLKPGHSVLELPLGNEVLSSSKIARGINPHARKHGLDRLHLIRVRDAASALKRLSKNPRVEYAEQNSILSIDTIPNDPSFSQLYGLHNTGQTGGTNDADIDAPEAWDTQSGSNAVVVAVIDTGIDYAHPDLAENVWTNQNEIADDGVDNDNNGYIDDVRGWNFYAGTNDPMDDRGHGTHVAGTIGAVGNNSVGVAGVAWNVGLMPLKFLDMNGMGTTAQAIQAIEYATTMGADIMSNSWGGGLFSQALLDAIRAANDAGILFVATAGNNGIDNDRYVHYPSNYDVPNVIAVAATDHNDNLPSWSNYGAANVSLAAPGVSIYSTVPNGTCARCDETGYRFLSGTSMATPHVSGVAALIVAAFPADSVEKIKYRILAGADQKPQLDGKTMSGARLNAQNVLENDTIAPAAVNDLAVSTVQFDRVTLLWTAPGDDENAGNASFYDVRQSTEPITAETFENATKITRIPRPQAAGAVEQFTVKGLLSTTTYYFAVKTIDNTGNTALSNTVTATTPSQPIVANASANPSFGVGPLTVNFTGTVTGGDAPLTYFWNFADGNSSTQQSPQHTFDADGAYNVSFRVTDVDGDNSTSYVLVTVEADTSPLADPSAVPTGGTIPLQVNFTGSFTGGNAPFAYLWDFNDSTNMSVQQNPKHNFTSSGIYTVSFTVTDNDGDFSTGFVLVNATNVTDSQPVANASANPGSGVGPLTVNFTGTVTGGDAPLTYFWNFADGNSSTQQSPQHTFDADGAYNVSFRVTDVDGDNSTSYVLVTVEADTSPLADPSAVPTEGAIPLQVNFTGSFTGGNAPFAYLWDFNDSTNMSVQQNPKHNFTSSGIYTVSFTVTDNDRDFSTGFVLVNATNVTDSQPEANASVSGNASGMVPLQVNFTGGVIGGNAPFTFFWDFMDGSNSTGQNPQHSFGEAGVYNASFTVTDFDGDSSTDNVTVTVGDFSVGVSPVAASVVQARNTSTVVAVTLLSGLSQFIDVIASGCPAGATCTFSPAGGFPTFTSNLTVKTFASTPAATYVINVSGRTGDFKSRNASFNMTVTDSVPVGNALAVPTSGEAPLAVNFTGNVSGGDAPLTFFWDFKDGSNSSEQSPQHTFTADGTYNVSFRVTDFDNDTSNSSVLITVNVTDSQPVANAGGPYSGFRGANILFDGSGSSDADGDALTYSWDFGDGVNGSGVAPVHAYEAIGTYTVTLVVNDGFSDSLPATAEVTITNQAPQADAGGPYSGIAGYTNITFDGSASSDADSDPLTYSWDFGDGNSGSGVNPVHQYADSGTYTVTLKVDDGFDSAVANTTASITPSDTISLSAQKKKVRGQNFVDLTWDGATSALVRVFRNNAVLSTTDNDGAYRDSTVVWRQKYSYKICREVEDICSNTVTLRI